MHKKVYTIADYIERFLILASAITRCISFFAFSSLSGVPIEITISAIGLKICAITAWIKKYKLINKKMKRKHDKILLLSKSKLNRREVFISKALIDSNISHDDFVLINNVLKEDDKMKDQKFK